MSETPRINEYTVLQPATSEGVRERILEALASKRGVLSLLMLSDQEVPAAEPVTVSFHIVQTLHLADGGGSVSGMRVMAEGDSEEDPAAAPLAGTVTVHLAEADSAPSTASVTEL